MVTDIAAKAPLAGSASHPSLGEVARCQPRFRIQRAGSLVAAEQDRRSSCRTVQVRVAQEPSTARNLGPPEPQGTNSFWRLAED
ncbi:unnamed protein product [Rangifer tarandus platyrhynchus]|uniref:Uncharacterized protein n=2 Tax=Rangifer tarandus platyrhynchus TaxID=3082113 RepID=A0ACB0EDI7_RANTA|nr:unnamed protein product [Rangifer tarandus platyrhynchus]CAI9698675.1 unnamed protein product [Rangifer tarandus platyrhynchus]